MQKLYFLLFLPVFMLCSPARAERPGTLPPLKLDTEYEFTWGALPIGRLLLHAEETNGKRQAKSEIEYGALLKLFSSHTSTTTLTPTAQGGYVYETNYSMKKKKKRVKLVYDAGGTITESIVEPPEPPEKRERVPTSETRGLDNPLSFLFTLRARLFEALNAGQDHFTIPMYEGRRLMESNVTIVPGNSDMTEVILTRRAIKGFTAKELKKLEDEPEVHVYFSNDERLIPVRIQAPLMIGTLSAMPKR